MHCRPKVMPPVVYPTKCCVNNHFDKTIVPHIHPSHTTNVNHHKFEHYHYYPHTESVVNEVSNQHFNCGATPPSGFMQPTGPVGPMGPMGPGPSAGPVPPRPLWR